MTDEIQPPVAPGDIIADKYRIESVLGQGGMGVVVAAQHVHLGQRVAVKFLLVDPAQNPEAVERFLREARAAVRIQSEHVARVTDVGTLVNGAPYMVMEFLVGVDLAELIRTDGAQPVPVVVDLVLQACEAIAEAHAKGIIHRDLKPANLFLTRRADGSSLVKVLDFGISKAATMDDAGTPQASMTATTAVMGSPLYMSPEQMRSAKKVDVRTDIWSLGVILFELLTGRPVYEADSLPGLCAMIASDPAPMLRSLRRDAPAGLEAVVDACLQKDPARRPQSVAELASVLAPFGSDSARVSAQRVLGVLNASSAPQPPVVSTNAHTAGVGQAASGHEPGRTVDGWGTTAQQVTRNKRTAWMAAGVGAAAMLGFATAMVLVWAPWRVTVTDVSGAPVDAEIQASDRPAQPGSASTVAAEPPSEAAAPASVSASASAEPPPPATTTPRPPRPHRPPRPAETERKGPPAPPPTPPPTPPADESDVLNERR